MKPYFNNNNNNILVVDSEISSLACNLACYCVNTLAHPRRSRAASR